MQRRLFILVILFLELSLFSLKAQQPQSDSLAERKEDSAKGRVAEVQDSLVLPGFPVLLGKDTLYLVYQSLGPFSAEERARNTNWKLSELFKEEAPDTANFNLSVNDGLIGINYRAINLGSVTAADARHLAVPQMELAQTYLLSLKKSALDYEEKTEWVKKLTRIGLFILTVLIFFFAIKFLNRGFNFLIIKSVSRKAKFIKGLKIKDYEFVSVKKEQRFILQALKVLKWLIIIFLFSLALPTVFSIFPATESLAQTIFKYLLNPVRKFGTAVVNYLPNLFAMIVIVIITRYILKLLYFLSREVEKEKLQISGFFPEWARPTFNLLRVVVIAFAFIVIFPYLPGSDSPVFQGVSVFLGLLISLGSSTAIGNIIAGLVITYMRAFKIGDRVKIGETTGDVIEKTMLVTRVRTIKNEEVSIPNSAILVGSTINFSANASEVGLVVHSTVTIGYDAPWRKVHELLINAALATELLKKEPSPFVLQTSLDDYSVSYQINAYTNQPAMMAKIKSELHQNIQDFFNKENIEILSPGYTSVRDGNQTTTPKENLPKDYKKPNFDINLDKKE